MPYCWEKRFSDILFHCDKKSNRGAPLLKYFVLPYDMTNKGERCLILLESDWIFGCIAALVAHQNLASMHPIIHKEGLEIRTFKTRQLKTKMIFLSVCPCVIFLSREIDFKDFFSINYQLPLIF